MKRLLLATLFAFALWIPASDCAAQTAVANVAALLAISPSMAASYGTADLLGYYTAGDLGPAATLVWSSASTATADNATVFNPTGNTGAGRWLLVWDTTISIRQCGAKQDGSTSDYAPLLTCYAAVNAKGGGKVIVPPGPVTLPSGSIASIAVPANTTTSCDPGGKSVFTVTGASQIDNLLTITDESNVVLEHCAFYGNSIATGDTNAGAILINETSGATAPMSNFRCEDCQLTNFKQPYWVSVANSGTHAISSLWFPGLKCTSLSGNDIDGAELGQSSDCLSFRGQVSGSAGDGGLVTDIHVDGMNCDATYIKRCVDFWQAVANAHVSHFYMKGCGTNTSANSGGYCLLAYNVEAEDGQYDSASNIFVSDGTFDTPFSVGFYSAISEKVFISDVYCSGQSDTANSVLPKGCVVYGRVKDGAISGLVCRDSYVCVVVAPAGTSTNQVTNVTATGAVADAEGIKVNASDEAKADSRTVISAASINLTGSGSIGIDLETKSGLPQVIGHVQLIGGRIAATSRDIYTYDATTRGGVVTQGVELNAITLAGTPNVTAFAFNETTTPLIVADVTVDAIAGFGRSATGLNFADSTDVDIKGLVLKNRPSGGVMLSLTGARGSMEGVTFENVGSSQRVNSTDFGVATPTWSADQGTFIQNLNPTGSGPLHGYTNTSSGSGTTWTPD